MNSTALANAQADLGLSMAGLASVTPTATDTPDPLLDFTNKIDSLAQTKQQKLDSLSALRGTSMQPELEDVTIAGFEDADTAVLTDGRVLRLNSPTQRYDAAEVKHEYDGILPKGVADILPSWMPGASTDRKSDFAIAQQKGQAAMLLGKPSSEVTEQDVYDVGNMQQVQVVSDLLQGIGQERQRVDLNPGGEYINFNDKNNPLNIKAKIRKDTKTDMYGRVLTPLYHGETGANITDMHAQDPRLNAFAPGVAPAESLLGRAGNIAKGMPAAITNSALGLADSTVEMVGKAAGDTIRLFDKENKVADALDRADLFTSEERKKFSNKLFGYDNKNSEYAMKEIGKTVTDAYLKGQEADKEGSWTEGLKETTKSIPLVNQITELIDGLSKVAGGMSLEDAQKVVGLAFTNPETTIESTGDIAAMILMKGKGFTALNKSIATSEKAIAKASSKGEKIAPQMYEDLIELRGQRTAVDKIGSVIGNNLGVLGVSATYVNDSEDEFVKTYGREKTYMERLADFGVTVPMMMLDRAVDLNSIKGVKDVATQLNKLRGAVPEGVLVKTAYEALAGATKLGAAGSKEFFQELTQETQQALLSYDLVNEDFSPKTLTEKQLVDVLKQGVTGGVAGFGSGVHLAGPSVVGSGLMGVASEIGTSNPQMMQKINGLKKTTKEVVNKPVKEVESVEYKTDDERLLAVAQGMADLQNLTEGDINVNDIVIPSVNIVYAYDTMSEESKGKLTPEGKAQIEEVRQGLFTKATEHIIKDILAGKESITAQRMAKLPQADRDTIADMVVFGSHLDVLNEELMNVGMGRTGDTFQDASKAKKGGVNMSPPPKRDTGGLDLDITPEEEATIIAQRPGVFDEATDTEIGIEEPKATKEQQEAAKEKVLEALGVSPKKKAFYKKTEEAKKVFSEYTKQFLTKNNKRNLTKTEFDLMYNTERGMIPKAAEALAYKMIIDDKDSTPEEVESATLKHKERLDKINKLAASQSEKTEALENSLVGFEETIGTKYDELKARIQAKHPEYSAERVRKAATAGLSSEFSKIAANYKTWEFEISLDDILEYVDTGSSKAHNVLEQLTRESSVLKRLLKTVDDGYIDDDLIEATTRANKEAFNQADQMVLVKKAKDLQKIITQNEVDTVNVVKSIAAAKEALAQAETDLNNAGDKIKKVYNERKDILRQHKRLVTELQFRNKRITEVKEEVNKKQKLLDELNSDVPREFAVKVMLKGIAKAVKRAINLLMSNTYDEQSYKADLQKDIVKLNDELVSLEQGVAPVISVKGVHTVQPSAMPVGGYNGLEMKEKLLTKRADDKLALIESKATETTASGKSTKAAKIVSKVLEQEKKIKKLEEDKNRLENSASVDRKKRAELLKQTSQNSTVGADNLKNALGAGLPAIKNSYPSSNGKAKEDVNVDPNVVLEVSDTPSSLLATVKVLELADLEEFTKEAIKLLDAVIDTKGLMKADGTLIKAAKVGDSPAIALLRTKDGKWNTNLVTALMLAMEQSISINANSWKFNTDSDIVSMLGLPNTSAVTPEMRTVFQKSGKFKSTVAGEIGDNMFDLAGFKVRKDADVELAERLSQELGQIGLLMAMQSGYLHKMDTTYITTHAYLKATDEEYKPTDKEITDNTKKRIWMVKAQDTVTAENTAKKRSDLKIVFESIGQDITLKKGPSFKELDPRLAGKSPKGNKITYVPNQSHDIMMRQWSQAHSINIKAIEMMMELVPGDSIANKVRALALIGYKSEEQMKNLSADSYDSTVASNAELESEYDEMVSIYERVKSGTVSPQVWFEWFFTRSGRFTLDSAGVNPQNNKQLDRWLVVPEEHTQYVNLKDPTTLEAWHFAIAQAFGFGTDKMSIENVKLVGAEISKLDHKDLLKALQNNSLKEIVITTTNPTLGKLLEEYELGSDHLGHTLQAIQAMKDREKAGGKGFTTTLSAEYDGITNGFINKTMQIPLVGTTAEGTEKTLEGSVVKETLDAGGIRVHMKGSKIAPDQAEQFETGKILDVYKKLAGVIETGIKFIEDVITKHGANREWNDKTIKETEAVYKAFQELVPSKTEGIISKALRDLFKPTVMTFGYASSINSIKKALGYNIANGTLDDVVAYLNSKDKKDKKAAAAVKYLLDNVATREYTNREGKVEKITTWNEESLQKLLHNMSADKISVKGGKDSLLVTLQKTMSIAIGNQVEKVMNARYGEMVKANMTINASFKFMFRLYKKRFTEKLDELTKAVADHNAKVTNETDRIYISKQDLLDITLELKELFPMIKAPLSFDLDSSMLISDSRRITVEEGRFETAVTHINEGVFADKSLTTSITNMIKELDEAQSAGAVIPLHFIDGSEMGLTQQEVAGILGVHDAILVGLDAAVSGPKNYNMNFYHVNKKFSMIRELTNSFARAAAGGSKGKYAFSDEELNGIDHVIRFDGPDQIEHSFFDISKELLELDRRVELARIELFSHRMTAQQMTGMTGTKVDIAPDPKFKDVGRTPDVAEFEKRVSGYTGSPEIKPKKGNKNKNDGGSTPGEMDTPEYDKLPVHTEGQKNMAYTAIGSRETPIELQPKMYTVAKMLEKKGYKLQSGGAMGADSAFEGKNQPWVKNIIEISTGKLIKTLKAGTKEFTDAWKTYPKNKYKEEVTEWSEYGEGQNVVINNKTIFTKKDVPTEEANVALRTRLHTIAKEIHPSPNKLSDGGLDLMARNTFQVFGKNLDTPVDFVLAWTSDGTDKGGTGQAIRLAQGKGIPVINMFNDDWEAQLAKVLDGVPDIDPTKEVKPKAKQSSGKLKWTENAITNDKGDATFQVNSMDDLIALSKQFQELMTDKYNMVSATDEKTIAMLTELFKSMETIGIPFKPVKLMFQTKVYGKGDMHLLGNYQHKDAKIIVATGAPYSTKGLYPLKVVAHEYAHAITLEGLKDGSPLIPRVKALMAIPAVQALKKDFDYAFTNEKEFIAEVMSNMEFQEALNGIEVKGDLSIVDKVKKIFKYILDKVQAKNVNTALTEALQIVIEINENGTTPDKNVGKNKSTETVFEESMDRTTINVTETVSGKSKKNEYDVIGVVHNSNSTIIQFDGYPDKLTFNNTTGSATSMFKGKSTTFKYDGNLSSFDVKKHVKEVLQNPGKEWIKLDTVNHGRFIKPYKVDLKNIPEAAGFQWLVYYSDKDGWAIAEETTKTAVSWQYTEELAVDSFGKMLREKGKNVVEKAILDRRKQLGIAENTAEFNSGNEPDEAYDDSLDPESNEVNIYAGTKENEELSNLAYRPFTINKDDYNYYATNFPNDRETFKFVSVEHAYQTLKGGVFDESVYSDPNWNKVQNGSLIKISGNRADTEKNVYLMEKLLTESFEANDEARRLLLATASKTLTHKQGDKFWRYKFPELLMDVRAQLLHDDRVKKDMEFRATWNTESKYDTAQETIDAIERSYDDNSDDEIAFYAEPNSVLQADPLYRTIKDKLLHLYPEIQLKELDNVFDDNGKKVLGKVIRDTVIISSTDGTVDTLSAEYARVYVNLLKTTTYMKNTLGIIIRKEKVNITEAEDILVDALRARIIDIAQDKERAYKVSKSILDKIISQIQKLISAVITPNKFLEIQLQNRMDLIAKQLWEGDNKDAIRLTPKEGTALINPKNDFDKQPDAANLILDIVNVGKDGVIFTGSEALAMQGDVYRKQGPNGTELHDLDFAVKSPELVKEISKSLSEKYSTYKIADFKVPKNTKVLETAEQLLNTIPMLVALEPTARYAAKYLSNNYIQTLLVLPKEYRISNLKRFSEGKRVVSYDITDTSGAVVGTYKADVEWSDDKKTRTNLLSEKTIGVKAFVVDLIEDSTERKLATWEYNGTTIYLSSADDIFKAKNQMSPFIPRSKDVIDRNLFDGNSAKIEAKQGIIGDKELKALNKAKEEAIKECKGK